MHPIPFRLLLVLALSANVTSASEKPRASVQSCSIGQHWVRAHHQREYVRANGTPVSASFISRHCADNPKGYDNWKPKLKNGRPKSWPIKAEKERKWTDEETERVLEALGFLPDSLASISIEGLYRMIRSRYFPNPASSSGDSIVVYDSAFDRSRNIARILAHELAHRKYRSMSAPEQKSYMESAGWQVLDESTGKIIRIRNSFVKEDGKDSPEEDFSNNVEYFLFNRERLQKVSPTVDTWIARTFGDSFRVGKGR